MRYTIIQIPKTKSNRKFFLDKKNSRVKLSDIVTVPQSDGTIRIQLNFEKIKKKRRKI